MIDVRTQRTTGNKKTGRSRAMTVAIVCLVLLSVWCVAGPYGFFKLWRMKNQASDFHEKNLAMMERNAEKRAMLESIRKDPGSREDFVRRELGWIRDGERVYEFVKTRK